MAYGMQFRCNNNKLFNLDQIQPIVYIGTYTMTGNQTITINELVGRAWLQVELVEWSYSGGSGMQDIMLRYTATNSSTGSVSVAFSNSGNYTYTAVFAVYARFV